MASSRVFLDRGFLWVFRWCLVGGVSGSGRSGSRWWRMTGWLGRWRCRRWCIGSCIWDKWLIWGAACRCECNGVVESITPSGLMVGEMVVAFVGAGSGIPEYFSCFSVALKTNLTHNLHLCWSAGFSTLVWGWSWSRCR